ncbi:MAG: YCF48-related protein [Ignavibacteria bacterium]
MNHPSPTNQYLSKCFFTDNMNGWISGDSGVIIHTSNGGEDWVIQNTFTSSSIEEIFFINNRLGWALSYEVFPDSGSYLGTRVFTTTNGGELWSNAMFPDSNYFLRTIYFRDSLNGFTAGSPGKIFKTIDGGRRWTQTEIDSTSKLILPVAEIKFLNSLTGYASGGFRDIAGSMWKTTNGGSNWKVTIVGPEPLNDLFINSSSKIIAVGGDFEYGSSYVKTTNAGAVWTYDTLGIFGVAKGIDFRTAGEGWIAIGEKFSYTLDTGKTWASIFTPDSVRIEDVCFTDSAHGWAVGYDGVILKYDNTKSSVSSGTNHIPNSFTLFQNFPNPFNPVTTINFDIHTTSVVSLKIYDMLGKEIFKFDEEKKLPGNYSVTFDATLNPTGTIIPSGIYFYELRSGDMSEVKKMILLK